MFNRLNNTPITFVTAKKPWFFEGSFFFILFLAIFLGDGLQAIVDVFLAAGLLFLFFLSGRLKTPVRDLHPTLTILWGFLLAYIALGSAFSFTPWLSVYQLVRWVAGFLIFRLFYVRADPAMSERFLTGVRGLAIMVSILSFGVPFLPFIHATMPPTNLLYSTYGHSHSINILFFAFPAAFWLWMKSRNVHRSAELVTLITAILFSFSRAGSAMLAFIVYAGSVLVSVRNKAVNMAPFIILGVVVGVAVWMIVSTERGTLHQVAPGRTFKAPLSLDARREYWRQAVVAFAERPLFGFGPGSFSVLSAMYEKAPGGSVWYSHNFTLGMLAETGLTGLLIWISLIITIFMIIVRGVLKPTGRTRPAIPLLLAAGAGSILLLTGVDFVFEHYVVWLLFWATLGVSSGSLMPHGTGRGVSQPEHVLVFVGAVLMAVFYAAVFLGIMVGAAGLSPHVVARILPFQTDVVERSIADGHKGGGVPESTRWAASVFHKNNADIQFELAKIEAGTDNLNDADSMFRHALFLAPRNALYHETYARFLHGTKQYGRLSSWLPIYMDLFLPEGADARVSGYNPDADAIRKSEHVLPLLFEQSYNTEFRFAKYYYLLGVEFISSYPERAEIYWRFSQDLLPDLSYFYIERASLALHVFSDSKAAFDILAFCMENPEARADCGRYTIDSLPPPGSQLQNVITFPEKLPEPW